MGRSRTSIQRIGRREYESRDKRFHAIWYKRQGARSCWRVLDRETGHTLRAFTLAEVPETIRDMLAAALAPEPR